MLSEPFFYFSLYLRENRTDYYVEEAAVLERQVLAQASAGGATTR